jgi:hypothetical protein
MDDQRLEEIAKRHAYQIMDDLPEHATDDAYSEMQASVSAAIREALSSKEEELRNQSGPRFPYTVRGWNGEPDVLFRDVEGVIAHAEHLGRVCSERWEELRSLREERDEAMKILAGGGLYRADASGELHEVPTTLLDRARMVASSAETEADIVDDIRADRESAKARAESAEAELLRLHAKACSCICHEDGVAPILKFYADVNARAEAEMLNGKPVTGAHHRALEAEIIAYRQKVT